MVPLFSGLVANRFDDEREDGDGEDEHGEEQMQLRDGPDGHAAADNGEPAVFGRLVGLHLDLGFVLRVELLAGDAVRLARGGGDGDGAASWSSPAAAKAVFNAPAPTTSAATRPRKTSSLQVQSRRIPSTSRGKK